MQGAHAEETQRGGTEGVLEFGLIQHHKEQEICRDVTRQRRTGFGLGGVQMWENEYVGKRMEGRVILVSFVCRPMSVQTFRLLHSHKTSPGEGICGSPRLRSFYFSVRCEKL